MNLQDIPNELIHSTLLDMVRNGSKQTREDAYSELMKIPSLKKYVTSLKWKLWNGIYHKMYLQKEDIDQMVDEMVLNYIVNYDSYKFEIKFIPYEIYSFIAYMNVKNPRSGNPLIYDKLRDMVENDLESYEYQALKDKQYRWKPMEGKEEDSKNDMEQFYNLFIGNDINFRRLFHLLYDIQDILTKEEFILFEKFYSNKYIEEEFEKYGGMDEDKLEKLTIEKISKEYNVSERTVYRWKSKINKKIQNKLKY